MIGNWILESCSTVGGGDLILTGAPSEYTTFGRWFVNGDNLYYTVQEGENSESGVGQYVAGRITRSPGSTLVNGVVNQNNPTPIELQGDAIVGCIMSAEAYRGILNNPELAVHIADKNNPHNVTKSQVGLTNVPNLDTTEAVNHPGRMDNPHLVSSQQVPVQGSKFSQLPNNVYDSLRFLEAGVNGSSVSPASSLFANVDVNKVSNTEISIAEGSGQIVDNTAISSVLITQVAWDTIASFDLLPHMTATGIGTMDICIKSDGVGGGTVAVFSGGMEARDFRNSIRLCYVVYDDQVITDVGSQNVLANNTAFALIDVYNFLSITKRITGFRIHSASQTQLSIYLEAGKVLALGINQENDTLSPNLKEFSANGNSTTPTSFKMVYENASGTVVSEPTTSIVPRAYEDIGVITALAGGEAVIHYLFMTEGGELMLLYGQGKYTTKDLAIDAFDVDMRSREFPSIIDNVGFIGQLMVTGNSVYFGDGEALIQTWINI